MLWLLTASMLWLLWAAWFYTCLPLVSLWVPWPHDFAFCLRLFCQEAKRAPWDGRISLSFCHAARSQSQGLCGNWMLLGFICHLNLASVAYMIFLQGWLNFLAWLVLLLGFGHFCIVFSALFRFCRCCVYIYIYISLLIKIRGRISPKFEPVAQQVLIPDEFDFYSTCAWG